MDVDQFLFPHQPAKFSDILFGGPEFPVLVALIAALLGMAIKKKQAEETEDKRFRRKMFNGN
jgi:hypothetical protein